MVKDNLLFLAVKKKKQKLICQLAESS